MSIRRRRGLVLAMEEMQDQIPEINDTEPTVDPEVEDPQPEQPETEPIVFPGAEETPEAREVDVQSAEDEVVAVEEQIDDAQDVIDQIGQVSEIVEQGQENGGLDQTGAQLLTATLESLYARVGLQVNGRVTPAIEEFGSVSSRLRSTSVAVEDMKSKVKVIVQNIMKALRVLWEKVSKFMQEIFTQMGRYEARSRKLRDLVGKVDDRSKVESFKDANIARALAMGNSISGNLKSDLRSTVEAVSSMTKYSGQIVNNFGKSYIQLLSEINPHGFKDGAEGSDDKIIKFVNEVNHFVHGNQKDFARNVEGDTIYSEKLLGNKRIGIKIQTGDNKKTLKANWVVDTADVDVNDSITPLNKNECIGVLDEIDSMIKEIGTWKELRTKIENFNKEVNSALNKMVNADEKAMAKIGWNDVSSLSQGFSNLANKGPQLAASYARGLVGASLSLVEKSLKAHTGQTAEENNNLQLNAPA